MLHLRGLAVGYQGVPVLTGVSLEARAGEVTLVLGANGVGKSTLLTTIMGLQRPLSGIIELDGRRVDRSSSRSRSKNGIAWVPEGRRLFLELTVAENISVAADAHGRDRHAAMTEALDLFPEIGDFLSRSAWALSGGQQQMVAVSRAIAARPRVLLLDEPSLGLAPMLSRRVLTAARRIADSGVAVLLVEQHFQTAIGMSDHAMVLSRGRVVAQGPAAELAADQSIADVYLGGDRIRPRSEGRKVGS